MHTIAACVLVLIVAQGVLAQSTSATTAPDPGTVEVCDRLHVFTANSHSGVTTIKYRNSQSSVVSTTVFQDDSLPLPAVCGESYKRCNLHITSNYDRSIRVAIFPLNSGIGLVSYDYLGTSDTLIFREQFVLTQTVPDCTYMYFTEAREVVGYCLDLHSRDQPYMHSLRIGVHHSMLNQSIVRRHNTGESIRLINLGSLSDLVFFDFHQDPIKRCFPDEGGHIVCLENGEVLDHSFSGENFIFYPPHISECSNASRLFHVGATCKLAAHCNDKVFLFEVHQDQATVLSNGGSGQVFVCPDLYIIVKSRTGTLSLQTESGTQTEKIGSFPLERIRQGDCFIVDNHYIFFATLVDGRTLLANFTDTSYQQLGTSEHATYIPSGVKGQIGLIHNGNDTVVYDLSLTCNQERMVVPDNFILANYFSTGTRDQCWCPSVSGTIMPVNQSTSSPTSSQSGSVEVVVVVVVVVVILMILLMVVVLITATCIYKKLKEKGGDSTSSNENGSQLLHSVEKPLIENNMNAVNLEVLSNGDQKSIASDSGSGSSQGIANPLLDNEQMLDSSPLPEMENLNPGHQLTLELRPESTLSGCTSENTTDSVLIQESYSNYPSSDHEMLIGATAASTNNCSVYPHKRLQEVGQASTTAVQCTSPRNSIIYAGAGSPSHTPGPNMVVVPQRSPVNYSAASQSESIVSDTLHPPPVEATPDDGHRRNYMAAPHHFLTAGANPHPDDVRRIHQQRAGRANEEDFGELVDSARANGGDSQPNNDVA